MNRQKLIDKYTTERAKLRPYCPNRNRSEEKLKSAIYTEFIGDLKQLDEPQRAVVPLSMALLLDYYKREHVKLSEFLEKYCEWNEVGFWYDDNNIKWIFDNPELFMRAWLNGYEVKKEPLYYVDVDFINDGEMHKRLKIRYC